MGSFGLSPFFALSSFLIVSLLLREKQRTGTVNIKAFMIRRMLRIWPLYYLGVLLGWIFGLVFPDIHIGGRALLSLVFLAGNLYVLKFGYVLGVITHLWSISVEEQFYLVAPWLARLGSRKSIQALAWIALLVSVLVTAWLGALHESFLLRFWPNSFVQLQAFAVGALLALFYQHRRNRLPLVARLFTFAAGIAAWYLAATRFHLHESTANATVYTAVFGYLLLSVGIVLIFLATLHLQAKVPAPLTYLGKISYGLYVFHFIWIFLFMKREICFFYPQFPIPESKHLSALITLALTILTAAISYQFFERPILRFKERFETVKTRVA